MKKNIESKKCRKIKILIQESSGVQNIGIKSRKRELTELKKIYYKLCSVFTKASLSLMANELGGYDHATALHGIKTFNDLQESNCLIYPKLYNKIFERLEKESKSFLEYENDSDIPLTVQELHQKFRISLIKIIEKSHSIINKKEERIQKLESLHKELLEAANPSKTNPSEYFVLRAKINSILLNK